MRRFNKSFKGFTLIEVLLVCSLFSLAGVMIYYSFSNGLKLWRRAQFIQKEEFIQIAMDKMGQDLRQAIYFSKIKFEGQENKIKFAGFVMTLPDTQSSRGEEGMIDQIGAVGYEFDALEKKLLRKQADYAHAIKNDLSQTQVALKDIDEVKFNFIFRGKDGYFIQPTAQELIPSMVEVEVKYTDSYKNHKKIERTYPIPVGI